MAQPFDLETHLGQALMARGWTLAVAESCTGGLVGHRITQVAGSSAYFLGGVISYSNDAKQMLLGVSESTLMNYGAVSEETALEMARGARSALGADVGIAITGISGPGGATPGKPVGLTWIAVVTPGGETAVSFTYESDRAENKLAASQSALTLALELTRKLDDPVQVEASFDDQGRLTPKAFVLDGVTYRVTDIGRRWDDGHWQHTLVMSPDGQTWDLAHSVDLGTWRVRASAGPHPKKLI